MRTIGKRVFGTLVVLVPLAAAARAPLGTLTLKPGSRLWVEGTSNVRNFACEATALDVQVAADDGDPIGRLLAGEKTVVSASVSVPAQGLDCRNGKMNEHMRKAIKAEEHPAIVFRLSSYHLSRDSAGVTAQLTGDLALGGVDKPITLTALVQPDTGDAVRVTGSYELRMRDWGLKPPSLMLGAFKVHDPVRVNFDLRFGR